MDIKVAVPPVLSGTAEAQMRQVYSYLYQLSQTLNAAGNAIGTQTDVQIARAISSAAGTSGALESREAALKRAATLRALIVNTAEIIQSSVNKLRVDLTEDYTAISSRYGTLQESVYATITAQASLIEQNILKSETITDAVGNAAYAKVLSGYIKYGIIRVDDDERIGIAIGQRLNELDETGADGTTKYISADSCALYTSDRVSFLVNGQELAYFSNQALHCGALEVGGTVTLSGNWEIKSGSRLTIRWIGGTV